MQLLVGIIFVFHMGLLLLVHLGFPFWLASSILAKPPPPPTTTTTTTTNHYHYHYHNHNHYQTIYRKFKSILCDVNRIKYLTNICTNFLFALLIKTVHGQRSHDYASIAKISLVAKMLDTPAHKIMQMKRMLATIWNKSLYILMPMICLPTRYVMSTFYMSSYSLRM